MSSTKTCAFWLKGQCTFGDQCKNLHGSQNRHIAPSAGASTCPHFLRGNCRFVDQCRLPHVAPSLDEPASIRTPLRSSVASTSWRNIASKPQPTNPISYPTSEVVRNAAVCVHHLKGTCKYGAQCRLSHSLLITEPRRDTSTTLPDGRLSSPPTTVLGICRFFQAGRCTRQDCSFQHVKTSQETPNFDWRQMQKSVPSPAIVHSRAEETVDAIGAADPMIPVEEYESDGERVLLGCKVTFAPGAAVADVTTAFESAVVLVRNIPEDASEETLLVLLETFGHLNSLFREQGNSSARIEYSNPRQAAAAIEGLTDRQVGSKSLSAQFEVGAVQTGAVTLRSTKVKMSFFAPAVIAYAHYSTLTKARAEADRLQLMTFDGHVVKATVQTPNFRQRSSFSVMITGLPLSACETPKMASRLQKFTHATSVTVGDPTYRLSEATLAAARTALETHGRLESFDVAPQHRNKVTIWVQFASGSSASQAVQELHNRPQTFIRNSRLWLEQVHSLRYSLSSHHFETIKDLIDRLVGTLGVSTKLRYYDRNQDGVQVDPVVMRLYSVDARSLSRAKAELDNVLQGERVLDTEGSPVWDDMFLTEPGRAFLDHIQRHSRAFVECQSRTRMLLLHGTAEARLVSHRMLMEKQSDLRQRRHVVTLDRDLMRGLLVQGFSHLQSQFGNRKLRLDVVQRSITVEGDDLDVQALRRILSSLKDGHAPATESPTGECPVCFCELGVHVRSLPCSHVYDHDCLRLLAQASYSADFSTLRCVADGGSGGPPCKEALPLTLIRDLLGPDEEARVLDCSLRSYINSHPDEFHYCPTPDCPIVYRPARAGTVIRCPSCLIRICAQCHVEHHEGISCDEHKDSLRPHAQLFARWKKDNGVRACPKCKTDIQKNGGCNHVACTACKTHICWTCMRTFGDDDSSGGVYAHMRQEHGGMY